MYSDEDLYNYVEEMIHLDHSFSSWEREFIESILDKYDKSPDTFALSDRQRNVIEGKNGLMENYLPF